MQYICIGTKLGTFHWYGLPKVFSKGHSNELRNFRNLLEREVRRVAYFTWRWSEREKEIDRHVQKETGADKVRSKDATALDDEDNEELDYMADAAEDQEFLDKVATLQQTADEEETK
jgi:hypothetical protein